MNQFIEKIKSFDNKCNAIDFIADSIDDLCLDGYIEEARGLVEQIIDHANDFPGSYLLTAIYLYRPTWELNQIVPIESPGKLKPETIEKLKNTNWFKEHPDEWERYCNV